MTVIFENTFKPSRIARFAQKFHLFFHPDCNKPYVPEHKSAEALKQFEQFKLIYQSAKDPESIDSNYFPSEMRSINNSAPFLFVDRSAKPLFGPDRTYLIDFKIDSNLIDGAEKFHGNTITPIALHAFRGNIFAVKQLLRWGADIKQAVKGFAAAGCFDSAKSTKLFLQTIHSAALRAQLAEAANLARVAKFNVEDLLTFRLK